MTSESHLYPSSEDFRSLFDLIEDFLFVLDLGGRIIHVNAAVQKRLGYSLDELRGRTIDVVHPCDQREIAVGILADLVAGRTSICGIPLLTRNGHLIPVETRVTRSQWNGVESLFRVSRDVTERKEIEAQLALAKSELEERVAERTAALAAKNAELQAEIQRRCRAIEELTEAKAALRQSESWHRSLIELGATLYQVIDTAGLIVFTSVSALRITGREYSEYQGRSTFEHVHPEDEPMVRQRFAALLAEPGRILEATARFRHGDGSWRVMALQGVNLLEDPVVKGVIVTAQDVTEKDRAERQLQESQGRLRQIMEAGVLGVAVGHKRGKLIDANDAYLSLSGYSREDLNSGRASWKAVVPPELDELHRKHVAEMEVQGVSGPFETEFVHEGRRVPVIVMLLRLPESPEHALALVLDDRERRAAAAALEESVRARFEAEELALTGRLAAGVAHEINNPLAGIKNAFRLFRRAIPQDRPEYAYVSRTEAELDRVIRIIRQIYELYRPRRGTTVQVHLDQECREVCSFMEKILRQKDMKLELQEPLPKICVPLPEGAVRQILMNLVTNAMDASREGDSVTVGMAVSEDQATVWVADRGMGMSEEVRLRIFEPFFSTKSDAVATHGLGLGLPISRQCAESFHGTLECESAPGQGSVFRLTIPLVSRQSRSESHA